MLKFHPLRQEDFDARDWDAEPLTRLLPDGAEALRKRAEAGDLLLTVFDADRPVGMLMLNREPTDGRPVCAVIEAVVLLEEYRRHGLGRMLMSLAAGAAVDRQIWFLAAAVPETDAARGFAAAMHMRKTPWYDDLWLLDLSDVEGMRHG